MASWKEIIEEGKEYFFKFNDGVTGSYMVTEILREKPTDIFSRPDMLILNSGIYVPWHAVSMWIGEEA